MKRPTGGGSPLASVLTMAMAGSLAACDMTAPPLPSLKDQTGYFHVVTNAPQSRFEQAGTLGDVGGVVAESSFGPAGGEDGAFRLAEVAPDQLEQTRTLLTQLGATQDADTAIRFSLPADVLFDFDKATLRADAAEPLAQAKRLIAAYPRAPVTIAGYTDAKGDDAYNDKLSLMRAQSVSARLVDAGQRRPVIEGRGERDPVAPNVRPDGSDDPAGRQRNRRVEIILAPTTKTEGN